MTSSRPSPFVVHTTTFEGPLGELLQLAQQGRLDLQTISLADIAEAYLAEVRREFDADQAADTIWQLAALAELKARSLLPQPPAPEEPGTDETSDLDALLEERMLEYRAFKDLSAALRVLEAYQQRVFLRPPEEPADEAMLSGVSLDDLFQAFQGVLARAREARVHEVVTEEITVADRMAAVLGLLHAGGPGLPFADVFPPEATRLLIVVTFLAVLELIRQHRIRISRIEGAIVLQRPGRRMHGPAMRQDGRAAAGPGDTPDD